MSNVRLIARLDIKGPNLIKGIHLEGLRVDRRSAGIRRALLRGRRRRADLHGHRREPVRPQQPVATSSGARPSRCSSRSPSAAASARSTTSSRLLRSGADKVAINTAAIARPELITEVAHALRLAVHGAVDRGEARRAQGGGRPTPTTAASTPGFDVVEWARASRSSSAPARSC